MQVRLGLYSRGQNGNTDTLTVDVDGAVHMLRPSGTPNELVAGPLAVREDVAVTDVFLNVPTLFTPKESGLNDPRWLGVAVTSIALEELG